MAGRCLSYKKGLSGKTVMIGRLYATDCGGAQCVLDAIPKPRKILIPNVSDREPTF